MSDEVYNHSMQEDRIGDNHEDRGMEDEAYRKKQRLQEEEDEEDDDDEEEEAEMESPGRRKKRAKVCE